MKKFIVLGLLFAVSAQASYFHTKCSNPSADLKWESGHNSNSLTMVSYQSGNPQEVNLSLSEVKITEGKMVTLKDVKVNDCKRSPISSSTKVTAGTVTIKLPSGEKVVTEVICEEHFNGMMYCP